jgi:NADH-quinone oxidoreductase subunit A
MLALFLLAPVLGGLLLGLNALLSRRRPDAEKMSPYECGMPVLAQSRAPFNVAYYLVALLFLIMDLDILLLWPVTPALGLAGAFGFWILVAFLAILTVGFAFEYGSGALKFAEQRPGRP